MYRLVRDRTFTYFNMKGTSNAEKNSCGKGHLPVKLIQIGPVTFERRVNMGVILGANIARGDSLFMILSVLGSDSFKVER